MAKRYGPDLLAKPEDYHAGFDFLCDDVPIAGLEDLYGLLCELAPQPRICVIRGAIKPEVDRSEYVARRSRDVYDHEPAFTPCAHHWAALDVDETAEPFLLAEPRACVERWVASEYFPEALRGERLVWQWSAQAHRSCNVRGRLWVWSEDEATDVEWRAIVKAWGFDGSVFKAVQPIYTAAPLFPEGVADPIKERVIWVQA
jgi:hypothetical protein